MWQNCCICFEKKYVFVLNVVDAGNTTKVVPLNQGKEVFSLRRELADNSASVKLVEKSWCGKNSKKLHCPNGSDKIWSIALNEVQLGKGRIKGCLSHLALSTCFVVIWSDVCLLWFYSSFVWNAQINAFGYRRKPSSNKSRFKAALTKLFSSTQD